MRKAKIDARELLARISAGDMRVDGSAEVIADMAVEWRKPERYNRLQNPL